MFNNWVELDDGFGIDEKEEFVGHQQADRAGGEGERPEGHQQANRAGGEGERPEGHQQAEKASNKKKARHSPAENVKTKANYLRLKN